MNSLSSAAFVTQALQISVMAGVRSEAIARASGSALVVRAMPNTPALIGQGIAGLYARPEVDGLQRGEVEALFAPTGASLWVEREDDLDAVTALSGSEPESFSGVTEQRARKASGLGAKRSHSSGYGEHLQRRAGVFGRDERA